MGELFAGTNDLRTKGQVSWIAFHLAQSTRIWRSSQKYARAPGCWPLLSGELGQSNNRADTSADNSATLQLQDVAGLEDAPGDHVRQPNLLLSAAMLN